MLGLRRFFVIASVVSCGWVVGCGGSDKTSTITPGDDGGGGSPEAATEDEGSAPPPADSGPAVDSGGTPVDDASGPAAPRNATCTPTSQQTGTAVNSNRGRLDGTLVYVLPLGGSYACNGDNSHVHLQVEVSGAVYDVAVDVGQTSDEVGMYETSIGVPGGTWVEGWHGIGGMTYGSYGLTSAKLPLQAPSAIASQIESALASTTKVSIFCTGYTQGNGCHDVHYENGSGGDGAIVLDPTSSTSPVLFFRFSDQSF